MGNVVRFPGRKKGQPQTFGVRIEIMSPWESNTPEEAFESIERIIDAALGDYFPEGSFQIDICGPDEKEPA